MTIIQQLLAARLRKIEVKVNELLLSSYNSTKIENETNGKVAHTIMEAFQGLGEVTGMTAGLAVGSSVGTASGGAFGGMSGATGDLVNLVGAAVMSRAGGGRALLETLAVAARSLSESDVPRGKVAGEGGGEREGEEEEDHDHDGLPQTNRSLVDLPEGLVMTGISSGLYTGASIGIGMGAAIGTSVGYTRGWLLSKNVGNAMSGTVLGYITSGLGLAQTLVGNYFTLDQLSQIISVIIGKKVDLNLCNFNGFNFSNHTFYYNHSSTTTTVSPATKGPMKDIVDYMFGNMSLPDTTTLSTDSLPTDAPPESPATPSSTLKESPGNVEPQIKSFQKDPPSPTDDPVLKFLQSLIESQSKEEGKRRKKGFTKTIKSFFQDQGVKNKDAFEACNDYAMSELHRRKAICYLEC